MATLVRMLRSSSTKAMVCFIIGLPCCACLMDLGPNCGATRIESEQKMAAAWEARKLLRAARVASLATVAEGAPAASLVTPAMAPDLAPLLLLSDLAEHTRHLRADPRCALLVAGPPADANPQTAPRVTLRAIAEEVADAALKARWLALHPYAVAYADFADFHLWRLRPTACLYVGGFAQAHHLTPATLAPDPLAVADIAAAEAAIIVEYNAHHPGRLVAVDVDGCDFSDGAQ